MTMGERLRELRLEKGYSLNTMADAVGMTPPGYLRLEDGTGGKTFEKLPVIAKTLGCPIDKLFPEMDPVDASADPEPEDDEIPF
ncbi:MAG: helix-turn-helix transcriptional regulator [Clostridia bacterium]|nr:helix-turn-helix transcriptional regulator [Clostridia bacterium]